MNVRHANIDGTLHCYTVALKLVSHKRVQSKVQCPGGLYSVACTSCGRKGWTGLALDVRSFVVHSSGGVQSSTLHNCEMRTAAETLPRHDQEPFHLIVELFRAQIAI